MKTPNIRPVPGMIMTKWFPGQYLLILKEYGDDVYASGHSHQPGTLVRIERVDPAQAWQTENDSDQYFFTDVLNPRSLEYYAYYHELGEPEKALDLYLALKEEGRL